MTQRGLKQAVKRAQRAAARADASVLLQQRKVREIKDKARKRKNSIKFKIAGDVLAWKARKISREEINRRIDMAVAEIQEIDESLRRIGVQTGDDQADMSTEAPTQTAPISTLPSTPTIAPKPKRPIVQFKRPAPVEFRRRLKPEFGLTYDTNTRIWRDIDGAADPAKVEAAIRAAGHWGLVEHFHGWAGWP